MIPAVKNQNAAVVDESPHSRSSIQQQLIGGLEANQTRAWVLDVEHDADDDDLSVGA